MTGRLEGKVAFITGAARGQGRSHAIRFAEEGADIIAVDICQQIDSNPYPLATPEDLDQTVKSVEALGRGIVATRADVRDREQLRAALDAGLSRLGRLDIVCANAGILPTATESPMGFVDAVDVDLVGVMNAVAVSLPHLGSGASIIVTGSTAGLMPMTGGGTGQMNPGGAGYGFAKRILVDYTETLALQVAPHMIRVNCVHPTNCDTHLLQYEDIYKTFRPDLENPTQEDALPAFVAFHAMPIPWVEPRDISNMILFLASDESRYVTGQQIRVDAGSLLKLPGGPA